jgi:hypothetical protein
MPDKPEAGQGAVKLTYNAQTAEMAIASRLELAFEAQPLWSRRATEQFA